MMREKVINRSRPAEPEGLPAVRGEYANDVLEHGPEAFIGLCRYGFRPHPDAK